MNNKPFSFASFCDPLSFLEAWTQVATDYRTSVNSELLTEYAQHLQHNLYDLSDRLASESYNPPSNFSADANGNSWTSRMLILEDLIVQQAAFNALGPMLEQDTLDCSFSSHSRRDPLLAIGQVLKYRERGDSVAIVSETDSGFGAYDNNQVMRAVTSRIGDARMLNLVGLWLESGLLRMHITTTAKTSQPAKLQSHHPQLVTQFIRQTPELLRATIAQLLNEGLQNYSNNSLNDRWNDTAIKSDDNYQLLKQIAVQFGQDALLSALSSLLMAKALGASPRDLLKPKPLAVTAASALAKTALPHASQFLRERLKGCNDAQSRINLMPSPMAPLLINVALHEFDQAMIGTGCHLVRYAGNFAVTTPSEQHAYSAYEIAAERLRHLRLQLHPQATQIKRFDQGVEFIGYRFHERLIAAEPVVGKQIPIKELLYQASGLLRNMSEQDDTKATQFGARAKEQATLGLQRIKSLIKRS